MDTQESGLALIIIKCLEAKDTSKIFPLGQTIFQTTVLFVAVDVKLDCLGCIEKMVEIQAQEKEIAKIETLILQTGTIKISQ